MVLIRNGCLSWLLLCSWFVCAVAGQDEAQTVRARVHDYRQQHEGKILAEVISLLSLPNVAANGADIHRNATFLLQMLEKRGVAARLLEVDDHPPVVFGELKTDGARKTIMFYMHYDGQPVNRHKWRFDPWRPVLLDRPLADGGQEVDLQKAEAIPASARLYARSASDDKSPIVAVLTALDALKANGLAPSVNVKFFFEGEEEAGSPNLERFLTAYRDLLQADVWLFCDGPVHQTRKPRLVFGARGIIGATLTVYGPLRPLHSGHYGNWAPNPISLLVHLLAGMRDDDGKIRIEHFYDDVRPISESERTALQHNPSVDEQLRHDLALAWSEGNGRLEERIMLPALNFRNIQSGGAAARNAIQTQASAVLGFRLVPNQTTDRVRQLVEAHIRKQGFSIVHEAPGVDFRRTHKKVVRLNWSKGYEPYRTPLDSPVSRALIRVLQKTLGEPPVTVPTFGGSLPLFVFDRVLHTPMIIVPMVNHDNNQHAENENLRIQNLWDGIEMYAGILTGLGREWGE